MYDKEKHKRLDHNREPVLFSLLSILGLKIKACVIPVEDEARLLNDWIPAFAGMTGKRSGMTGKISGMTGKRSGMAD